MREIIAYGAAVPEALLRQLASLDPAAPAYACVAIGEEIEGYRPSTAIGKSRVLAHRAEGKVPRSLLRVFRNQIRAAEQTGVDYDRAQSDLEDVAELVREAMEKKP